MTQYATSIGLDVLARSIAACAFDPMTGEATHASFPYDPAAVAEWALSFDAPRAVYESGVTGFHLCRALRALGLDCAVGAVSRMQKPAADRRRKTDRRDAEFLARLLATRNVVEVDVPDEECEARPRPVARARGRARGPAARQAAAAEVPAEARARLRRADPDRREEGQLDPRLVGVVPRHLIPRAHRRTQAFPNGYLWAGRKKRLPHQISATAPSL